MTRGELLNRELPKWPQCIITGENVTLEQADEIIRRTDTFLTFGFGGNDHRFDEAAKSILHLPQFPSLDDTMSPEDLHILIEEYHKDYDYWRNRWQLVSTSYIKNSWISTAYIGGPCGWCHPDGTIGYSDNIGKWPSCEDVLNDLETIAKTWPFLRLEVTLMDDEYCGDSTSPVISFVVRDGIVDVVDPDERNVHEEFNRTIEPSTDSLSALYAVMYTSADVREHAITLDHLQEWYEKVFADCEVSKNG